LGETDKRDDAPYPKRWASTGAVVKGRTWGKHPMEGVEKRVDKSGPNLPCSNKQLAGKKRRKGG